MSKLTDLASFQLDTQGIAQTIKISDIQVTQNDVANGNAITRVDMPHESVSRSDRVAQLQEFTQWLASRDRSAHHDPSAFISEPLSVANQNSGVVHRVDAPSGPQNQAQYQSPHFDTTDYVEAVEVDNSRQPRVTTERSDPAPSSEDMTKPQIVSAINELRADGRVLGDSEQFDAADPNLVVPAFKWPEVSSNLLGSPAILNLENNIKQSLQTYRTQIVVASSNRRAGASTVALSLARQLAESNKTVLLIDADLENPSLAGQLGLTTQLSWTAAIHDGRPTNRLIVKQKNSGLSLLPLIKPKAGYDSNVFDTLATISNPLAWIYDYVVIDVGPVSQYLANSSRAKIRAASTLLVADVSAQNEVSPHRQHAHLRQLGVENVLVVQNFSHIVSASKVG